MAYPGTIETWVLVSLGVNLPREWLVAFTSSYWSSNRCYYLDDATQLTATAEALCFFRLGPPGVNGDNMTYPERRNHLWEVLPDLLAS